MHTPLLFLTLFSVSQLLWLVLFLAIHHPNNQSSKLFIALCFGLSCYLLMPFTIEVWQWGYINYVIVAFSIANPGLIWLFCYSIFQPDNKIKIWHYATLLFYVTVAMMGVMTSGFISPEKVNALTELESIFYFTIPQIIKFSLLIHTIIFALQDWKVDLIAGRRAYRAFFVAICAINSIIIVVSELWLNQPLMNNLFISSVVAVLLTIFTLSNFKIHTGFLLTLLKEHTKVKTNNSEDEHKKEQTKQVVQSLNQIMQEDHCYKEHGLTVTLLAEKLKTPAYILRQVINQELNYSNFNHYLNEYRIKAALIQLVAKETEKLPIITIALDVGFRSLSTFNKAFKEQTGQTPTQYRQNAEN